MKKVAIFLFLILLGYKIPGQINKFGVPLIRNYNTQITKGSEQNWCITKDKFGNLYFGNQNMGVVRYDGTKWSRIPIGNNPRIYSLETDSRGIIYVGAAFEFGYIQPDKRGNNEYISLASRVDSISKIGLVQSIVVDNGRVLFLGPRFLYVYNIDKDSLETISLTEFHLLEAFHLVKINEKLIISDSYEGLFELKGSVIAPLPGGGFFKKMHCTILLPYDENKILVSTYLNGIFLYDFKTGVVRSNFINEKWNETLKDVNVYAGAKLKEDLFAIGTTKQEGILVFNKKGELVQQIKKENSALEDNTVYALYCDYKNNSELWISTLGYISKAYFNIPLTEFSEKQGITSGVNEICEFAGSLYLSSDAGVLKSYVDNQNNVGFKKVQGISTQVFPLEVFKSSSGDDLLAGSLEGLMQISKNDIVNKVESNCSDLPKYQTRFNSKKILQSARDPEMVYLGLETGGVVFLKRAGNRWHYIDAIKKIPGEIYGLVERREGGIWFMTDDPNSLYSLNINGKDTTVVKYGPEKGVPDVDFYLLTYIHDELYVSSAAGILKYDKSIDKFIDGNNITAGYSEGKVSQSLFLDDEGDLWYSGINKNVNEILFRNGVSGIEAYKGILNLLPNVPLMDIMYSEGKIYLLKSKVVYVIDKSGLKADTSRVRTSFVNITAGEDSVIMGGTFYQNVDKNRRIPALSPSSTSIPEFGFGMNEISFSWTTPNYTEELFREYSYKLEGFDRDWSKWEGISLGNTMEAQYSKKEYTNLPFGQYKFKVKTRTLIGLTGNELNYEFIILKPWYSTNLAYVGFALAAFLIVFGIIKAYTRKLKNENIRLEGIVAERTAVVVKQKDELESSIHYASRIQMALLPSQSILSENISKYFVLFRPRDIVSGDFYWMSKKEERLYIVAADCTGHGVPGAFMSLLGMSFLDQIIDKELAPRANVILRELRLHVTESLKQVGGDDEAKDGMDMALLVIDFRTQRIEYSGAYNPCFRVRKLSDAESAKYHDESIEMPDGSMSNGKYLLETIYPSKMPIGISSRMDEEFVFQDWPIEKGISYYLFSDGYIDQFGGPEGRKFMKKSFKQLLLDIQDNSMKKQKELLEKNLEEWMGLSPQIDDVLVMGIRID
jgi:serine phosphatase RsbU (regulator of sigma subunit)